MDSSTKNFEAILKKYRKPVIRQALKILNDRFAAEEIAQDVFMNIYRHLDSFREESRLDTWLYRITLNRCLNHRKRIAIQTISLEQAENDFELEDDKTNPEVQFLREEERTGIERNLSNLSPREAAVITLCCFEERSYKEAAEIMDISNGTVAVLLHRGRLHLHELLIANKQKEATG